MVALAYVVIGHEEPEQWAEFARVMGASSNGYDDQFLRLRLDNRLCRIGVTSRMPEGLVPGWDAGSPDAYHLMLERLTKHGISYEALEPQELRHRGVCEGVHFMDPSGLRAEVVWGQVVVVEPFVSPTGVSRFVTGSGGMGHIALVTPFADELVAFYTNVFEARISDVWRREAGSLTFLRFSEREHSVAIMEGDAFQLLHMMVEAGDIDDVGMALDRAHASRWEVKRNLGRHSNDRSISFYVTTPSPFQLEFGCASSTVHETDWLVTQMSQGTAWGHRPEPPASVGPS